MCVYVESEVIASRRLAGRRLLVVEDNFLIAHEIASLLKTHGAIVLGPASTVSQALRLLRRSPPDGALLDVKLGNETGEPVAAAARQRRVPILLLTGIDPSAFPAALANEQYLSKPFQAAELVAAVASLLTEPPSVCE